MRMIISARAFAAYCAMALGAWFAGVALLTLFVEPSRMAVVIGSRHGSIMETLAASPVAVVEGKGSVFTVSGLSAGFVRELYAGGAWLVLPAVSGGCGRGRITPPSSTPR